MTEHEVQRFVYVTETTGEDPVIKNEHNANGNAFELLRRILIRILKLIYICLCA